MFKISDFTFDAINYTGMISCQCSETTEKALTRNITNQEIYQLIESNEIVLCSRICHDTDELRVDA